MYSANDMKLLGFHFNSKPTVHAQVDNLVKRAAGKSFVIRRLAGVHVKKERLKSIYCSIVRSTLKYSRNTYGSMLAKYEKNRLENVQKNCLRCIFSFDKNYEELLAVSGLSSLEERRQISLKKVCGESCKERSISRLVSF